MAGGILEPTAIDVGWEFIESQSHSPSEGSPFSLEDVFFPSPQANVLHDLERSASNFSHSSNEVARAASNPSSWNSQRLLGHPNMAMAGPRWVSGGEVRQVPSSLSSHPSRPMNSYPLAPPSYHQASMNQRPRTGISSQPLGLSTINSSENMQYQSAQGTAIPNSHFNSDQWNTEFPIDIADLHLADPTSPPRASQISPGASMTYAEHHHLNSTSLEHQVAWSPSEAPITTQIMSATELLLPGLEYDQFDMATGMDVTSGHYDAFPSPIDAFGLDLDLSLGFHDQLSPIQMQRGFPDSFSHLGFDLSTQHTAQPPQPSGSATEHYQFAFPRIEEQQQQFGNGAPRDAHNVPIRPSTKPVTSSTTRMAERGASATDAVSTSSTSPISTSNVIFEEIMTPKDKGKIRRPSERQPPCHDGRVTKRAGGRALGTHLDQETLQHTNRLRQIGACWICRFQRDKCLDIGGDVCGPCARRHNSAHHQSEHSLGCDRTNITEYRDDLLPALMTEHFKQHSLKNYVEKHIGIFMQDRVIVLQLRFDPDFPPLATETCEFKAKNNEILQQYLYRRTAQGEWACELSHCPPLCMTRNPREEVYERYVTDIVKNNLHKFAETCFHDVTNDFQKRLLELLCAFKPSHDIKELDWTFRFFVTRILVTSTWYIPSAIREETLSQLQSYQPGVYGPSCSPRMTNKQIKSCFNGIHYDALRRTLGSYQDILRKSGGKWVTAFIMVIILAMVTEDCQKMMHATAAENASHGYYSREEGERRAVYLAQNQDDKWCHIMSLFRAKYTARGFNPFKKASMKKQIDKNKMDPEEVRLVRAIEHLMLEKNEFLHGRQHVPINGRVSGEYTSRLVARFLLHFWSDPL